MGERISTTKIASRHADRRMLASMIALDHPGLLAESGLLNSCGGQTQRGDSDESLARNDGRQDFRRGWAIRFLPFLVMSG
jgi:hypothetical protein